MHSKTTKMAETGAVFHPIISSIQKIALYETKSKFYLVGSNNTQTRFRVIKIDRMDPKELFLVDDKVEYTPEEINDLITMIYAGNRQRSGLGVSKVISAFGIVGFIRFLEGYYIILITKRRKVAVVGLHTIYKIEDTSMIYIPHESCRVVHPEEPRYVKMFQNIDLASNFYFSYSYDITHSLQHNMTHPRRFLPNTLAKQNEFSLPEYISMKNLTTGSDMSKNYGIRTAPHRKFVWNSHLLSLVEAELHPDWLLYVVHGFIGQSNISIYGRAVYVTLIARRSSKYAGTRFLKRGANFNGDVANEVETEQMVHDSCVSSLSQSHFTSFLQMRGSIPGHWKQEMGKMVGKPAITMDLCDPFAETAGLHFNELLKRYGAPIIVLNLVKKREKKQQESLLSDLLSNAVIYLNQFLAPEHQIIYKTFDMARKSKGSSNVLRQLGDIAKTGVMKTGFFHNQRKYFSQRENTIVGQNRNNEGIGESLQTGIIRTNCVDCLDRTNTAQFAIGKCVLGYQLCALGILDTPDLEFDTDCVRMLELLYEDHGDTLALQYGGSQLVHRIKTYRKTAPWTSQGNDIMQTLSRYYSNTFSDAEKQNTINLFLGTFVPNEGGPQIWDYSTDYYFHHKPRIVGHKSLTQWWDKPVLNCLPFAYNDLTKTCFEIIEIHSRGAEMTDAYIDYHRPFELSVLSEVYSSKISNSIRDFMPDNTTDYSPFSLRIRPVKRRDGTSVSKAGSNMKNPSVTGQSSSNSTTSSSSDESSCDDEDSSNEQHTTSSSKELTPEPVTFKSLFPPMKDVYGTELKKPSKSDILVYKKYVLIGKKSSGTASKSFTPISVNLKPFCADVKNSSRSIEPPVVDQKSVEIYKKYVELGISGEVKLNRNDLIMYQKYSFFV